MIGRGILSGLVLAGLLALGATAAEEPKAPVYCGTFTCFQFRVPAEGRDPEARASMAMDVINKFLGGSAGKVTTKPAGKSVRLLLNNEFVAVVTPDDAAAEKQKSAADLAAKWARMLSQAFQESKAQK